ncbi:MAG TPA: hypothetical protein VGN60_04615 [Devosia sp.]|jgi:cytochrome bd-type quinol oxidase subunit 2|nr:hypothetical protein [Devosia sp.]
MKKTHARWRRWASAALLVLNVALTAASFLPLLESRAWWVRYMDYPRLQLLIVLPILLVLYLALRWHFGKREWAVGLLTLLAVTYHGFQLCPYTALAAQDAVELDTVPTTASSRYWSPT